jgi:hypothetical protein
MPVNEWSAAVGDIRTPEQGARVLWTAVIYQAVLDATEREPAINPKQRARRRESAIEFLTSERYRERCEILGIGPVLPPAVAALLNKRGERCCTG